jgi:integrase
MLDLTDGAHGTPTIRGNRRHRPANKGRRYPADPPRVEEIVAVMRQAGTSSHGQRLRGLIVVLWRAGLRISEALSLTESDLEIIRGSVLVRSGKGGRRREVGMDEWAWDQLRPWLETRALLPLGTLFCVINGPTSGGPWSSSQVRITLSRTAIQAGVRRRFAHISFVTLMPSRWRGRACPSTSSSVSSATRTWGSTRSTFRASIVAKSSRRSELVALR